MYAIVMCIFIKVCACDCSRTITCIFIRVCMQLLRAYSSRCVHVIVPEQSRVYLSEYACNCYVHIHQGVHGIVPEQSRAYLSEYVCNCYVHIHQGVHVIHAYQSMHAIVTSLTCIFIKVCM